MVLSGGGAHGLTHVGVLQALEEHDIQVDYITGTSIGALVGAMYAAGYSPEEMKELFTSSDYKKMSKGEIKAKYKYFNNENDREASLLSVKISNDSTIRPLLPTNLINAAAIDLNLAVNLAAAEALSGYDFNNLMIPFRCVASDIHAKEQVIFSSGSLSNAVRASMAYPFFIQPIKIDGKLLYDGGLYNNFPADIMCNDFNPDFIIGSNVSSKYLQPDEDDLIAQIRTMLMYQSSFEIDCAQGFILEPVMKTNTFDFDEAEKIIEVGYQAMISKIDSLKKTLPGAEENEINRRREEFKARKKTFIITEVNVEGLNARQQSYASKILGRGLRRDTGITISQLKSNYYRLYGDAGVENLFPTLTATDSSLRYFRADVRVKKEAAFSVHFGGNFASRPASHGYLGLTHNHLSKVALRTHANTYFGRLYTGAHIRSRLTVPGRVPISLEPHFTVHRYNYFQSRTTSLLTEEIPGYMILNETFGGMDISLPFLLKGNLKAGVNVFEFEDDYYQTRSFTSGDTSDISKQNGFQLKLSYERDNLNYNQFATKGKRLWISASYIDNREVQIPGSTNIFDNERRKTHQWFLAQLKIENYFLNDSRFRFGYTFQAAYSTQDLLSNYTATIARAQAFRPTVESRVLFLESFRAYQFTAAGLTLIYDINDNFHVRAEGYLFQPVREINRNTTTQEAELGELFERRYSVLSGSAVYQSPIGPVSLSVNYYHDNPEVALERRTPVTVFFNFGYLLFNKRTFDY